MSDAPDVRPLTASEERALAILRASDRPMRPGEFAEKMWPDSEGWQRSHKVGPYGAAQGAAMALAAGGYLGKLQARGLIRWVRRGEFEWGYMANA